MEKIQLDKEENWEEVNHLILSPHICVTTRLFIACGGIKKTRRPVDNVNCREC